MTTQPRCNVIDKPAGHTPPPWRWREVPGDNGGHSIALLLETTAPEQPHNDPCVLAVRDDWIHYLLTTARGRANLAILAAAPEMFRLIRRFAFEPSLHTSVPLAEMARRLVDSIQEGGPHA